MADRARIFVLAGTNGAGKSSVLGEAIQQLGGESYNPDQITQTILAANPGASLKDANSEAWNQGKRLLKKALAEKLEFTFETTLGASTIPRLLAEALKGGAEVRVWYVGLANPELHIARVARRVAKGGHDIPEQKIRERYDSGRKNLIRLLPELTEMKLFDNSADGDPDAGKAPSPRLILHAASGRIKHMCKPEEVPEWAKSIVMTALESSAQ